jgi:acyl-CoA synthetase (AMP-forming)/AMP-acid ligase II
MPNSIAVACPRKWSPAYHAVKRGESEAYYATTTFVELDADVSRIARGLIEWGVPAGTRLALLVRPGIEFVTLVFALLRAGMVVVLVDPGLGKRNLVRCLAEAEPEGFVAIGLAQAGRLWLRRKFPRAKWNVTVGRRWFWGGLTLEELRALGSEWNSPLPARRSPLPASRADDPAAIIFTSGSTGPPKGVLYTQRMFDTQVAEIQSNYGLEPGGVDLACFPLFALFNSAMGVTTVMPKMDFSRPASAKPEKLLAAASDWQVTQAFASPAVWSALSTHCAKTGERISSLRQVFSCGAPVATDVLRKTLACVGDGAKMHTPYGMTECLPVSTIEAAEVCAETAAKTDQGAGVCVGRKFDSIEWRVIRITDGPIATIDEAEELPAGEIGELVVRGPQVSPKYVTSQEANTLAKVGGILSTQYSVRSTELPPPFPLSHSPLAPWHRTGDVGYLDDAGRFWYCGRKSQRVETAVGPLYTECVEAIFNAVPLVERAALVGVGKRGQQTPVIVIERRRSGRVHFLTKHILEIARSNTATRQIESVLFYPRLPVDIRHNAKINREQLTKWAGEKLKSIK